MLIARRIISQDFQNLGDRDVRLRAVARGCHNRARRKFFSPHRPIPVPVIRVGKGGGGFGLPHRPAALALRYKESFIFDRRCAFG